jgi:hypothetical protein
MSLEHSPIRQRRKGRLPSIDHLPLLLRDVDAAYLLGISRRRVWQLIRDGRLERVRIEPRSSRITSRSVLALAGDSEEDN